MMINRKWLVPYLIVLLTFIGFSGKLVFAANKIDINFDSSPQGALVEINGEVLGKTPLSVALEPDIYQVKVVLANYGEWSHQYAVFTKTTIFAQLGNSDNNSSSIISLPNEPLVPMWASMSNEFRFKTQNNGKSIYYTIDLDKQSLSETALPFAFLSNADKRNQLKIPATSKKEIYSVAYQSPSGRYIAYIPRSNETSPSLALYDTQTKNVLKTDTAFDTYVSDEQNPPIYLIWSPNEQILEIGKNQGKIPFFVFINSQNTKTLIFRTFKSSSGNEVYVDKVLSNPLNDARIFVSGHTDGDNLKLWLVNLSTLTGDVLQDINPSDAEFSQDGKSAYVVTSSSIVLLDLASKSQTEIASNMVEGEIVRAILSPSLNYVYLAAGNTEAPTFWLYKIPNR